MTPCQMLLSTPNSERYLKPGVTEESLKAQMMAQTHLAAATEMQEAKQRLFAQIHRRVVR